MASGSPETTLIGPQTGFSGDLRVIGDLYIEGRVEGNTVVDGVLTLTNACRVKGNVQADIVVVDGEVEGDILALEKLEILPRARICGNCISPSISIRMGAQVTGWLSPSVSAARHHGHSERDTVEARPAVAADAPKKAVG